MDTDKILRQHKLWAENGGAKGERADLSRADLSEADLSGADLSEANLSRANLSRANLSRANLSEANLSEADLSEANLSRADLSGANLSRANLSRANLSRADLSGANLSRANLGALHIWQFGPVGSRGGWLVVKSGPTTDEVMTGCFRGTLAEFEAAVQKTHGDNKWGRQYQGIISMAREWIKAVEPIPAQGGG